MRLLLRSVFYFLKRRILNLDRILTFILFFDLYPHSLDVFVNQHIECSYGQCGFMRPFHPILNNQGNIEWITILSRLMLLYRIHEVHVVNVDLLPC